ncbi:hypothetical protein MC885_018282 [Smutsia gigantea]|nr:hypothetical protein MC885_018282 [Smutsia gigantea]
MEEHGERTVLPESRPRATSIHHPTHLLRDDPHLWREGSHPSLAKAKVREHTAQVVWSKALEAARDHATNITKRNQEHALHKDVEKSQHSLYFGSQARLCKIARFQDRTVKRMLSELQDIVKAALTEDEPQEGQGQGPEPPLEEEGIRGWWEDASLSQATSPSWWG